MNQRTNQNQEAQIRADGAEQSNDEFVELSAEMLDLVGGGMRVAEALGHAPIQIHSF